ncbi:hypothetical protein, partial [Rubellimicrobium roseum]|uniref:hypothetical protein n=1 Tax=Rubellimicrobium roseum TaxID=687525 RepID=UPI001C3F43B8
AEPPPMTRGAYISATGHALLLSWQSSISILGEAGMWHDIRQLFELHERDSEVDMPLVEASDCLGQSGVRDEAVVANAVMHPVDGCSSVTPFSRRAERT